MNAQGTAEPVRPLRRLTAPPLPQGSPPIARPGTRSSVPEQRRASEPASRPDPRLWAGQFLQAVLEITIGLRQPAQVMRWVDEAIFAQICRRAAANRRPGPVPVQDRTGTARTPAGRRTPIVLSVHSSTITSEVIEVASVVHDGQRIKALACRLEAYGDRWRVTALEFG